jgi:hypothetical protein
MTLDARMWNHKSDTHCSSSKILEYGDARIELIENYPCDSKKELVRREGEIIMSRNCVNLRVAGLTRQESCERYRQLRKDNIKQSNKIYREANRDKIKANRESNRDKINAYREANKERINHEQREQYAARRTEPLQPQPQ